MKSTDEYLGIGIDTPRVPSYTERQQSHWTRAAANFETTIVSHTGSPHGIEALVQHFERMRTGRERKITPRMALELGSATGAFLPHINAEAVIGLDFAYGMVRSSAMFKDAASLVGGVVQADNTQLPFTSTTIDEVYTINGLHSIYPEDNAKAFAEIARVLKPKGLFFGVFHSTELQQADSEQQLELTAEYHKTSWAHAQQIVNERFERHGIDLLNGGYTINNAYPPFSIKTFTTEELQELAHKAGFSKVRVDKHHWPKICQKMFGMTNRDFEWVLKATR